MHVKICGITRAQDASLAVELGATMLGFIFAPSPRLVSSAVAAEIGRSLPPEIRRIGVFRNAPSAEILKTIQTARLTGVQFHGGEDARGIAQVRAAHPHLYLIQVLEVPPVAKIELSQDCDILLLDSPRANRQPISLNALLADPPSRPYLLAGGLNSDNVGHYVRALKPAGIDVASGVETSPGIKNPSSLKTFFQRLREAQNG